MMDIRQQRQYQQIGAVMKDFVERAVAFYTEMPSQAVCRPAGEGVLERLEKQGIP